MSSSSKQALEAEASEMLEILREYHEAIDILDDGPDDDDVALAMGHLRAAHNSYRDLLLRLRASLGQDFPA